MLKRETEFQTGRKIAIMWLARTVKRAYHTMCVEKGDGKLTAKGSS